MISGVAAVVLMIVHSVWGTIMLVRVVERSHTPAFWERLERVIPDYADRQRWLKTYGGRFDL